MGSGLTKTIAVIVPALSLALVAGCHVLSGPREPATELLSVPRESATELPSVPQESPTELLSVPQESTAELPSVPQESTTERMNRLCESCGVSSHEANKLITNVQRVEIKRKDAIGLFKMSFRELGNEEACAACAEAIMDVVDEISARE